MSRPTHGLPFQLEAKLGLAKPAQVVEVRRPPPTVVEVVRPEPEKGLEPQPRYPVGVYKVTKVPGITAHEAEQLRTYGVNLTDELLHQDLDKLAAATGVERARLQRWRDISELMAIHGIGAAWATRLVDADVGTIAQLSAMTPEELTGTLLKSYERQGASAEKLLLFRRTLPSRSKKLVAAATKASKVL